VEAANTKNKEISVGAHVRYTGTGSAGEVLDLRSDNEGLWVKLDTTQLWYNSRYLELMDAEEYHRLKSRESRRKIKKSKEDSDKDATRKKMESIKRDLENVDMSTEMCDGGG